MKRKTTKKSVTKKNPKKAVSKKAASKKMKPKGKAIVKNKKTTKKVLKGNKSLKKSSSKKPAVKTAVKAVKKAPVTKSKVVKKAEESVKPKSIGNKASKTKEAISLAPKYVPKPVAPPPPAPKPLKRYKPNTKIRYTPKELKHFKDIILEERRKIIQSAKANMEALVDDESGEYVGDNATYASHMAEQGSDEMEREKNYMFVQRDEKYLGYLEEALIRIDAGTYGVCIDCFETPKNLCRTCPLIDPERLELVPVTQHCIECKNLRGMVNY